MTMEKPAEAGKRLSVKADALSSIFPPENQSSAPKPLPTEHVGTSPRRSRQFSPARHSVDSGLSRGKSLSFSTPLFPVPPPARRIASPVLEEPEVAKPTSDAVVTPATDGSFLTALASQERRVLELKEELQRAEDELTKLKRQWAQHESMKRKNGARSMHQMRTLSVSMKKSPWKSEDQDGSSAWLYEEMQRRKALMVNAKSSQQRRVFSGSRHTRALSLLTPANTQIRPSSHATPRDRSESQSNDLQMTMPSRSYTTPDLTGRIENQTLTAEQRQRADSHDHVREDIIHTGKQLATDLREGLWTFFEDLRQATVGEEARNKQGTKATTRENGFRERKLGRKTPSLSTSDTLIDTTVGAYDDTIPNDEDLDSWGGLDPALCTDTVAVLEPVTKTKKTPSKSRLHTRYYDGEGWESWDSPGAKSSSARSNHSPVQSNGRTSPSPLASSPPTSASDHDEPAAQSRGRQDSIPWPALNKLAPEHLKRTATLLMDEWEKTLSLPNSPDLWKGRSDPMDSRPKFD